MSVADNTVPDNKKCAQPQPQLTESKHGKTVDESRYLINRDTGEKQNFKPQEFS